MPTWKTRGLRGSVLEDMINITIDYYQTHNLALIQKIPTPIKPVDIDPQTRHITLAYFDRKSTVDYIGAVQGVPVCFDAKESAADTFPLHNIHEHQIRFMENMEKQDGIAFILLYFSGRQEAYYVPFAQIKAFWERGESGGKKSFNYDEVDKSFRIRQVNGVYLFFLEQLQMDLLLHEDQGRKET